jgi:gliding motility-associated-like protein
MKNILLLVVFALFSHSLFSQIFWTETFGTGCNQGQNANGVVTANGTWTVANTGVNAAEANQWFISATEAGMGNGNCGDGCLNNGGLTDRTLHIGSDDGVFPTDLGAAYNAGGLCGILYCIETDKRAESPVINCTGQNNIQLSFHYIEFGDGTNDDGSLWYFDGAIWSQLINLPKTTCCDGFGNSTPCTGTEQALWTTYSIALPPSANNNPSVKIGFRWVNNDDGAGTDPSFAVDSITLSAQAGTPPTAAFSASSTNICENDCITFTDNSTGSPTSWMWYFPGGVPATFNGQTPPAVCYAAAGNYTVSLVVANINGQDSLGITNYISVGTCVQPTANFTANNTTVCTGDCINFTDLSTNALSWMWYFPGGTPATSTQQNPTICYNVPGVYTVSLVAYNGPMQDSIAKVAYITVQACTMPVVQFVANQTEICDSMCISFTDQSTNNPTSWQWFFPGAVPGGSNLQNPTNICYYDTGTFTVTLIATNQFGSTTLTKTNYIKVKACNKPKALFDMPIVCYNSCVNFFSLTENQPDSVMWVFEGANQDTVKANNPQSICWLDTTGCFSVKLYAWNAYGVDSIFKTICIDTLPTVDAGKDTTIFWGGLNGATLFAQGSNDSLNKATYIWYPSNLVDCYYCQKTNTNPDDSTLFIVKYTDHHGCVAYDTVWVFVKWDSNIGVPNAFSPNLDGNNDILYVRGKGIKSLQFTIYNRYGQQVFESTDQTFGWDGTHKGKDVNPGVYVYFVDAILKDDTRRTLKGNVTLIR